MHQDNKLHKLDFIFFSLIEQQIQNQKMQAVTISVQNQKRALELKYLLHLSNQENQDDLLNALNRLYPFTEYPLSTVPPVELIQTDPIQTEVQQEIDDDEESIQINSINRNKQEKEGEEAQLSREKVMKMISSVHLGKDGANLLNPKQKKKCMRKLTDQQKQAQYKQLSNSLSQQIEKYSYIVLTGGLLIQKGQHKYIENRFVGKGIQDQIFFNINQGQVGLFSMGSTCYLRIHNIWIEKAKKKYKANMQEYTKQKLLQIPFFANLTFKQFQKCYKTAYLITLGPGDVLLETGATPYHMYIVAEGELVFQKSVKFLKDQELWTDVKNQLQRQSDDTCQEMFRYLVKQPKAGDKIFEVVFKIKNISQNQIICAKETLCEETLTYSIVSTLKTKLIYIKYPDLYHLSGERLTEIRNWSTFGRDNVDLRRDFYYQMKWSEFKEQTKKESQLNKLGKQKFEDFLRKDVNLNQEKAYYCPNKIGEGSIIDNPAGKVSKLKAMTYLQKGNTKQN